MRIYAILKKPEKANDYEFIYKVMLHKIKREGVMCYMYTSADATRCSYDHCYSYLETAHEDWDELIDEKGWIEIEDPVPLGRRDDELPAIDD
ncbi:hypothetical protein HMPREF1142_2315 [Peptostreptococcaceae bacterium AS15]|nr:hypothetical protein HMPREF1142_2315 [Peptostreptococcaceae bacterium AS15]